jgi:purine-binding chemotaxis protein CheW
MNQFLIFTVSDQRCAINITSVKEVLRNVQLESIPDQPKFIEGILNVRGKMLPVINLRTRFLQAEEDRDVNHRILLVHIDDQLVGLKVDSVEAVSELEVSDALKKHLKKIFVKEHFISGIATLDDKQIVVLDVNEIFSDIENELLASIVDNAK